MLIRSFERIKQNIGMDRDEMNTISMLHHAPTWYLFWIYKTPASFTTFFFCSTSLCFYISVLISWVWYSSHFTIFIDVFLCFDLFFLLFCVFSTTIEMNVQNRSEKKLTQSIEKIREFNIFPLDGIRNLSLCCTDLIVEIEA